ncbi:MAG: chemotaxis protein CheD [Deltaproteobacteria bacterium]|nr:chemotaxis protein CheD [Deltaproteobacteria bacterium]
MAQIIVGIADFKISNKIDDSIVTYALGSCVAIVVYDWDAKIGGMLHYMLSDSMIDARKAAEKPAMFADTGIPLLFKSCYKAGAEKRRMNVKVIGGARILDRDGHFEIGQKNIVAARKIFWKNNVIVDAEDTGGDFNRTVRLDMATGRTHVYNAQGYDREL